MNDGSAKFGLPIPRSAGQDREGARLRRVPRATGVEDEARGAMRIGALAGDRDRAPGGGVGADGNNFFLDTTVMFL